MLLGSSTRTATRRISTMGEPYRREIRRERRDKAALNDPDADVSPWMFLPADNIKEFSTSKHPGLATIYEAGKGKDIKGLLKDPIRIDDFRLSLRWRRPRLRPCWRWRRLLLGR